ncbi:MAG: HAMP domain-containing protein [Acidobacteria bacterium]|nr:MAG: HAMP domain-containing protein [Acidobacteriota bacterium]
MSSRRKREAAARPEAERTIGRRLAAAFGTVAVLSVTLGAALLLLVAHVSGLVGEMRRDETAIKASLTLAAAVREQYIHQAHWMLSQEAEHLGHYEDWLRSVRSAAATLRPLLPPDRIARLEQIERDSGALDRLFRERIVPAVREGRRDDLLAAHAEAERLSSMAARRADALARSVELDMAGIHRRATRATTVALALGVAGMLGILLLSAYFTIRLRESVLRPLERLAVAARRLGSGDFSVRVGPLGRGELRAVARAFDSMAEELQDRERRLVDSERMAAIGQLAAGVAHEINNPIGIIRGYIKSMDRDSLPPGLREEIEIIDDEAAACQRIAEDLLAYARTPSLRPQEVPMHDLIEDVARRLSAAGGLRPRLRLDLRPGRVHADPERMRQVLQNLVRNAAEAGPEAEEIEISGGPLPGGGYEFTVSDRGKGISEEERVRVFEPFFSRRAGGSGLGLAVCRGIVGAHGGTIAAEPRPGGGTTIRVRLPAARRPER